MTDPLDEVTMEMVEGDEKPFFSDRETHLPPQPIADENGDEKASATDSKQNKDEEKEKEKASLGPYFRLFRYASKGDAIILSVAIVCAIGSGVALPLMNIVFGNLTGSFNEYFLPGSKTTEDEFKRAVSQSSLKIVYLFIARFGLTYIAMLYFRVISLRISAAIRLEYMQSLLAQPISKLEEISVGTVANTITGLSNTIQQSVSDKLAILFQSLALLVTAYVISFRYSWALTLATSSAILFVVLAFCVTIPLILKLQRRVDKADEKHASIAAEAFNSIRTVFSLGAEAPLSAKYQTWIEEARNQGLKLSGITAVHLGVLFFSMYASFALAFWFGLRLYSEKHIGNINTVVIVFFSVMIVVTVLGGIASPLMIVTKAASAATSFFDMIDAERLSGEGIQEPEVSAHSDIVFEDVAFSYPTRKNVQVLKGFTAHFEKGKTTALVGPSGSGKSTIVALLERWYTLEKPQEDEATEKSSPEGIIRVDGRDINDLQLKWWRTQVGLVQQEPFLFNDTIFNNVSFGLVGSKWENEPDEVKKKMVELACKEAFADEFVEKLPQGYSTLVGEGGIKLSGGQRQRLAIARSIIKQPSILILDEATSAIDVRGEKIVQAALDRVSKDRTTIVIAHRLSTIRKADQIIVMREGRNVEQGTHGQLLEIPDGIYQGLVNAQKIQELDGNEEEISDEYQDGIQELAKEETQVAAPDEEGPKAEVYKTRGFFSTVGLLLYEQRRLGILYVMTLLAAMGAGSGYSLQAWLFAKLIQVFQFTGEQLTHAANFWALMFFILALAMFVCYAVLGFASSSISTHIAAAYRTEYFQNIVRKPISYFDSEENAAGSLLSRVSTDPKQVQELLGVNGALPSISIFNVVGCIIISFVFGWKLSLVAVLAILPVIFIAALLRVRYEMQFEEMNAKVYAGSSQFATEAISAFRTVTALTLENYIMNKYSILLLEQRKKAIRKAWYATLAVALSDSIQLCAMALTFWYGGQLLANREYTTVTFFVVYMAIIQGGQAAGQFFSLAPNLAQATASANRIISQRPTAEEILESRENVSAPLEPSHTSSIEFQNVSFKYLTRETPTFTGLNFKIESGQFVAFVGPSGCGKTTVISLLERFYDPIRGEILFNERDIRSIELRSYRKALSLVAQEPKLFDGTIRENLVLGLPQDDSNAADSEARMIQACRDAEIHDFIISLPDGYGTELGINAQKSLSGGQKQRLCIARALLRSPSLLLLDEATSSLDSQSEKLVQAAIDRLAGKRSLTIVAVAHRLATIQKADVIFVFGESEVGRGAKIIERGSHNELLRRRGAYWLMCQAQALDK